MPKLTLYFDPFFEDKSWAGSHFKLEAPEPLESHHQTPGEWLIGRHPQSDVTIGLLAVSRKHAAISYSYASDRWSLQDLGSTGGTRINGEKLEPHNWHPLAVGDRVHFADALVRIVEDEQDTLGNGDQGSTTVAGKVPLHHITGEPLEPLEPKAPSPRTYADSLYFGLEWLFSARTVAGKVYRIVVASAIVSLAIVLLSVV